MRTCVCNPAALKADEELHERSKGYLTSVGEAEGAGVWEREWLNDNASTFPKTTFIVTRL